MERSTTSSNPPTPPSLIGPFPRHEGRAALKALITETTPVLICPYLSAFVVAAPGRGLSHTKPTECLSVCLLLCPPCGATYLNVDPNYLAVTTFLKHAYANKICVLHMILYKSSTSMSWVYFVLCGFLPVILWAYTKHLMVLAHSNTDVNRCGRLWETVVHN